MIKFVITIVDQEYEDEIKNVYKKCDIKSAIFAYGKGTASTEILDILGLCENQKIVIFSLLDDEKVDTLTHKLSSSFEISKKGRGVSFVINISGISKNISDEIKVKDDMKIISSKEDTMNNEYELIFTIVEEDYLEAVKLAATGAGARGGTSIKALGLGTEEAKKFFGLTINEEKEIMLNVVKKEDKKKIMEAIIKEIDINSKGKGICFSVPVDKAIGLAK